MTDYSFQLYSARNFHPINNVLRDLAAFGYKQVEGYGALYGNLEALRNALSESGLTMTTGHFDLAALETDTDECLSIAKTLGMRAIYCAYLPPERRPDSAEGWRDFATKLQAIAARVAATGLAFGWHNHDFEFTPLPDGSLPIDLLLATSPAIDWEADLAWVARAGKDPIAFVQKYADRITAVHIKDLAPKGENTPEDGWADVGYGMMDWRAVLNALKPSNTRTFVVEHDNPNDLNRFAGRSIQWLKQKDNHG